MAPGEHPDINETAAADGDLFVWDAAKSEIKRLAPAAAVASPAGGSVIDVQARAAIDLLRAALTRAHITA